MTDDVAADAPRENAQTQRRRLEGREAFLQAVRELVLEAANGPWSQLYFCAPQFADWPLGEAGVVEALIAWARRGGARHCHFIALDYERWPQQHPRWMQWRQTWSHLVSCWQAAEEFADHLPSGLLLVHQEQGFLLELTQPDGPVAWLNRSNTRTALFHHEIDAILQRSTPGFSASVLGL